MAQSDVLLVAYNDIITALRRLKLCMVPLALFLLLFCYPGNFDVLEIARDHLQRVGHLKVIGGVMSPVHDAYKKQDLVTSEHRCNMLRLALSDNDWVRLSEWESCQSGWTRTCKVLQYHQNQLNSALNANHDSPLKRQKKCLSTDEVDDLQQDFSGWIPNNVSSLGSERPVRAMLLCGADVLESFAKPGLWNVKDIETIVGQHGIVVITREGTNPYRFIYESDILTKYMGNIVIVTEWITNEVSSTKIRRAFRRGDSIKYLVPDSVMQYITQNQLYFEGSIPTQNENKYLHLSETFGNRYSGVFLTPSRNIGNESPSPSKISGGYVRTINVNVKSEETISKMAEFLGSEFGSSGEGSAKLKEHEFILNEENMKKSSTIISKAIPKSSSRDCLDGRKVSLASMPSPKSTKHFRSVDDGKSEFEKESKVEIKITDDGILVISDKETTV